MGSGDKGNKDVYILVLGSSTGRSGQNRSSAQEFDLSKARLPGQAGESHLSNKGKGHEGFLGFLEGIEKRPSLGSHLLWVSLLFLVPEVLCCPENTKWPQTEEIYRSTSHKTCQTHSGSLREERTGKNTSSSALNSSQVGNMFVTAWLPGDENKL